MIRPLLALIVLLLPGGTALAQTRDTVTVEVVQIIHADSSVGESRRGKKVRKLLGHVRLQQGETEVRAARAVQYVDTRFFELRGGVMLIDRGRDTLQAPVVRYYEQARRGEAAGGIRYTDGEVVLTAPEATYDLVRREIHFSKGVHLQDSVSVLESQRGIYRIDPRTAFFWGDVHLIQEELHIYADTLVHERPSGETYARGHVVLYRFGADSTQMDILMGASIYHHRRKNWSKVEGEPLFVRLTWEEGRLDTLLLRAHRLEVQRTDSVERVIATGDVRLWRRNLAVRTDSAVYLQFVDSLRLDRLALFHYPRAWMRRHQITGDTVEVYLKGSHPRYLHVRRRVYVGLSDSLLARIHQIKGKWLGGWFQADTLREVHIGPNAEAVYFLREKEELSGAVTLSADTLRVYLREEQPERIVAVRGIAGTYYEKSLIPEDLHLEGFRWLEEERPSMADLLRVPTWMQEWLDRLVVLFLEYQ